MLVVFMFYDIFVTICSWCSMIDEEWFDRRILYRKQENTKFGWTKKNQWWNKEEEKDRRQVSNCDNKEREKMRVWLNAQQRVTRIHSLVYKANSVRLFVHSFFSKNIHHVGIFVGLSECWHQLIRFRTWFSHQCASLRTIITLYTNKHHSIPTDEFN